MRAPSIWAAVAGFLVAITAFGVARAESYWGSIYVSSNIDHYGATRGEASPQAARKKAAHLCKLHQHGLCTEVITFSDTCAAGVALKGFGSGHVEQSYGATGDTPRTAGRAAQKICTDTAKATKRLLPRCETITALCAQPK